MGPVQKYTDQIIYRDGDEHEDEITALTPGIKQQTCNEQYEISESVAERIVKCQRNRQKQQKKNNRTKNQRRTSSPSLTTAMIRWSSINRENLVF